MRIAPFVWVRSEGGCELTKLDFLVARPTRQGNVILNSYEFDWEQATLFREFGELGEDREKILSFAAQYGLLGLSGSGADPLAQWVLESRLLQWCWNAHEALVNSDEDAIARLADSRPGANAPRSSSGNETRPIRTAALPHMEETFIRMGTAAPRLWTLDTLRAAHQMTDARGRLTLALQEAANEHLKAHCEPILALQSVPAGTKGNEATVSVLEPMLAPKNLLGILWLQCVLAIGEGAIFKTCAFCGRWLRVGAGYLRTDSDYCSKSCRQQALYRRKTEARRLHAQGVPTEEIAARIDTNADRVRAWVEPKNGGAK